MNKELNLKIDQFKDEIVSSLQELVQTKSVESEPEKGIPFGKGVNRALNTALHRAEELGLKTKNVDGYAGYTEIGEGEEMLGILCHLDVVPEGKDWTYPPYSGEIHDGKIYGRGTIDNKGPAVGALYALKAIQDCGIKLSKRVRLILGTDEESGWQGLNYYLEHEEIPGSAFSPDAEFPVIHAEKGILTFRLKMGFEELVDENSIILKTIEGGNAPNMVPDYCEARLETTSPGDLKKKFNKFTADTGYKLELEEDRGFLLKSHGISAHGSLPQDGRNAISQLMEFLSALDLNGDSGKFISFYNNKIGTEYNGQSIGCDLQDEVSGRLTFNVGMIKLDSEGGEITVNIRYPVTSSKEKVFRGIDRIIEDSEVLLEEGSHMEPLYVPKDDPLVQKLMKVYQEFTDDKGEAIAIGGGTYARAIEKAVAFGPVFPGQPELAHQKNEFISIEDLLLNTKIYANAIIELAGE